MQLKVVVKQVLRQAKDHLPEILTVTGVGGQVASNILFVRAAKLESEDGDKKHYILPVTVSAGSIAAIVASNRVSNEQKVALVAAGVISAERMRDYRQAVRANVDDDIWENIEKDYSDADLERLIIEADATDELEGNETRKKQLFYWPQFRVMSYEHPDNVSIGVINLNHKLGYSWEGEVTVKDYFEFVNPEILKKYPHLKEIADDYCWCIDTEDPEGGLMTITVNQYTKTTKDGADITFVYFMQDPLRREEWQQIYSRFYEFN